MGMSNTFASTDLIGRQIPGNESVFSTRDIFCIQNKVKGKYCDVISANNGKLYFIPCGAEEVISFDVKRHQKYPNLNWNRIGNRDLGNHGNKWRGAVCAENGKIYCSPYNFNDILIIDTNTDTTDRVRLPPELWSTKAKYCSCVSDGNGYVYFFPCFAPQMIKINIYTNEISFLHGFDRRYAWN